MVMNEIDTCINLENVELCGGPIAFTFVLCYSVNEELNSDWFKSDIPLF